MPGIGTIGRQALLYLTIVGLSIWITSCGGASITSSSSTSSTTETSSSDTGSASGEVSLSQVSTMTFENGSAQTTLSVADDDEVVVVVYSYNSSSSSDSFQVGSTSASESLTQFSVSEEDDHDITEDFHNQLRELEADIDDDAEEAFEPSSSVSYAVSVGSEQTFKVLNSYSSSTSYDTVTATLRVSTSTFDLYVDNRNEDSISDAQLQTIADNFADDEVRTLYGTESDVNSDGKFQVLFTQTVNELGASAGGMVTGFFYAIDLFDDASYSISNEREIFYTLVPDPTGEFGFSLSENFANTNIYPTVLPHEYQHMISFNQHYFVNGGSAESSWLNEALSHLAEDVTELDSSGYMDSTSLENPSRVSSYLSSVDSTCFFCGSSLKQRGGSYLFVRYLYEQAELGNLSGVSSGAALIDALLDTSNRGTTNITQAIFGTSSDSDLAALMGLYSLALYLDGAGIVTDDRFAFSGIDLRGVQDDNRGTSLSGPATQTVSSLPFTDSLSGNSISYLVISGSVINANNGVLELTVDSDAEIGAYVIEL